MRADDAADRVVRLSRRAHPVAHRLVGRVAEGPRAGRHGHDGRAQRPHVEDVELLAADVLLAHVDRAFQAEQGAGRRRGHAVLPGAGLGDHPRLAHPLGEHDLADRVVDLVGAGVVQVLALQVDRRPRRPAWSAARRGTAARAGRRSSSGSRSAWPGTRGRPWPRSYASASRFSASIRVSGTNRPPNAPNRPSGSGPGRGRARAWPRLPPPCRWRFR